MQSKTAKLINEERVIAILDGYGADADNWPEEERAAAIALINGSAALQQRQRESQQLDELMGVRQTRESLHARADAATVASIINALPEQVADNTINLQDHLATPKLKRHAKVLWTYGAVAAAAVVMLAVSIIIQQPTQTLSPKPPIRTAALPEEASQQEMDQWLWQDATGAEPVQEDDETPTTFLAMVELDLLPTEDEY